MTHQPDSPPWPPQAPQQHQSSPQSVEGQQQLQAQTPAHPLSDKEWEAQLRLKFRIPPDEPLPGMCDSDA